MRKNSFWIQHFGREVICGETPNAHLGISYAQCADGKIINNAYTQSAQLGLELFNFSAQPASVFFRINKTYSMRLGAPKIISFLYAQNTVFGQIFSQKFLSKCSKSGWTKGWIRKNYPKNAVGERMKKIELFSAKNRTLFFFKKNSVYSRKKWHGWVRTLYFHP